ncbi:protein kinase domain-containing protein [Aquabacterium humicola]|uniref:protein kinase domain-containing protein n=1 Tax=Aquabacterium humicola TaxID=3237377 RepID=UPI002542ED4E|nr:protein kinase [Rubrivivax pictus]
MADDERTIGVHGSSAAPERLLQYTQLRAVGHGGMGVVYQARDVDLDRPVAIKLLHGAAGGADPTLVERLLREARSAAQLIHPNVALVYQVGRQDGLTFIVMEWLDGGDLAQVLRERGALPWREAVAALRDAAAGLAAAHAAGLVHRDVKPSNLMRTAAGQVKLVDFGLARLHEAPSDLTQAGALLGTPAYLSPEQCMGEAATPLSDVYALGCTAFQLLTGRAPFAAANGAAVLYGHLNKPLPDARSFAPDLPDALLALLERLCAKDPAARPASAVAVRDAFDALLGAGPAAVAPPTPRSSGNLALDATSFIGRERDSAAIAASLQQARLVTLTGPGGTGKTRLSHHVARRLAHGFSDGVWLIELAPLPAEAGEAALLDALAEAMGLREAGGGAAVAQALIDQLRAREALLLLDNCEHVIEAAAALARRIVERCERVRVLATSRQPLGVPGEQVVAVPPLPTGDERASVNELAEVDAVRLFVERAAAVRPGFMLSTDNAAAVAQICRRLDGIPLAIELAAARVKLLTPPQIAARLADAFKLLAGGQRTLLPRQQTLRALIDWSWDLLVACEQRLFARLAVFAGDFSLDAAEAVLPDDADAPALDVLEGLASLVDKSLVVAHERPGPGGGEMRYRLLETMRQYAAEKLGATGEAAALQQRHAVFYLVLAVSTVAGLHGSDHAAADARLQLEHDNMRAALDAAGAARWFDIALPGAKALAEWWFAHGVLADGVARLEWLIAQDPPDGIALAELLQPAGRLAMFLGRHALARAWFERGLPLARAAGERALEARLLGGLGSVATLRGELPTARRCFADALALCSVLGDLAERAKAHNNLGMVLNDMGDVAGAREHLTAALQLHRASKRPVDLANGLLSLAELEQADGQAAQAQPLFESSLNLFASLGDEWSAAYARDGLGRCALRAGDLDTARAHFEQALAALRRAGDQGAIADQLDHLAQVALLEARPESAARHAREGLALRLALDNPAAVAASLQTCAALHAPTDPVRGARLLGAMDVLQRAAQAVPNAVRMQRLSALCAQLAGRLGDETFARLRADGAREDPLVLARAEARGETT